MPIDVNCHACDAIYMVPNEVAGKKIRCPKCSDAVIEVPASGPLPAVDKPESPMLADTQIPSDVREDAGQQGERFAETTELPSSPAGWQPPEADLRHAQTFVQQPTFSPTGSTLPPTRGDDSTGQGIAPQGPVGSPVLWQLRTPDGEVYGPVDKMELDRWVNEGRVNQATYLAPAGKDDWQGASVYYPFLAEPNPSQVISTGQPFSHALSSPEQSPPTWAPPQKSRLVAGLLAIFLGMYGVHNFYLGNNGVAVAQLLITLLTCVGAPFVWIWGIVEGVQILTGSVNSDAHGVPLAD